MYIYICAWLTINPTNFREGSGFLGYIKIQSSNGSVTEPFTFSRFFPPDTIDPIRWCDYHSHRNRWPGCQPYVREQGQQKIP